MRRAPLLGPAVHGQWLGCVPWSCSSMFAPMCCVRSKCMLHSASKPTTTSQYPTLLHTQTTVLKMSLLAEASRLAVAVIVLAAPFCGSRDVLLQTAIDHTAAKTLRPRRRHGSPAQFYGRETSPTLPRPPSLIDRGDAEPVRAPTLDCEWPLLSHLLPLAGPIRSVVEGAFLPPSLHNDPAAADGINPKISSQDDYEVDTTEQISRTPQDLLFDAKLAEQTERYDDMAHAMKELMWATPTPAGSDTLMTSQERDLLRVGFFNAVGQRRAGLHLLDKQLEGMHSDLVALAGAGLRDPSDLFAHAHREHVECERTLAYRRKIAAELRALCQEMLKIIKERLLPACTREVGPASIEGESQSQTIVTFKTWLGDYHRYLAETWEQVVPGQMLELDDRDRVHAEARRQAEINAAENAYLSAARLAEAAGDLGLPPTSPVRMGVSLAWGNLYARLIDDVDRAVQISKKAFDEALAELHTVGVGADAEERYEATTRHMQLLRENVLLWCPGYDIANDHVRGGDGQSDTEDHEADSAEDAPNSASEGSQTPIEGAAFASEVRDAAASQM